MQTVRENCSTPACSYKRAKSQLHKNKFVVSSVGRVTPISQASASVSLGYRWIENLQLPTETQRALLHGMSFVTGKEHV